MNYRANSNSITYTFHKAGIPQKKNEINCIILLVIILQQTNNKKKISPLSQLSSPAKAVYSAPPQFESYVGPRLDLGCFCPLQVGKWRRPVLFSTLGHNSSPSSNNSSSVHRTQQRTVHRRALVKKSVRRVKCASQGCLPAAC